MKYAYSVLLCHVAVFLLGCEWVPRSSTAIVESQPMSVFEELTAAVGKAIDAKNAQDVRLEQYALEKKRLVALFIPTGESSIDFATADAITIERYAASRDAESAKNLCVVLELEEHAGQRRRQPEDCIAVAKKWLEAYRLYQISGASGTHNEEQTVELFVAIERLKDLTDAPPPEPPLREIDGACLQKEFVRLADQQQRKQREMADAESLRTKTEHERQQMHQALARLGDELSQERRNNSELRVQVTQLRQQNEELQQDRKQVASLADDLADQVALLKAELSEEKHKVARQTQNAAQARGELASGNGPMTVMHRDQTPRPMAPYGYWASPSGHRYGYGGY